MEVNLDALAWKELTKFGDSEKFANWRVELEDEPEWILSGEEAGWENDSATVYSLVAEGWRRS